MTCTLGIAFSSGNRGKWILCTWKFSKSSGVDVPSDCSSGIGTTHVHFQNVNNPSYLNL